MLEVLIIVLVVLWLVGAFAVNVGGGLIHILLVLALIILVIRLARGDKIV